MPKPADKRIDLRALMQKYSALAAVEHVAAKLLRETAIQPPILGIEQEPYALAPIGTLTELRRLCTRYDALAQLDTLGVVVPLFSTELDDELNPPAGAVEIVLPFTPDRACSLNKLMTMHNAGQRNRVLTAEKTRVVDALKAEHTVEPRFDRPVSCEVVVSWGVERQTGKGNARDVQQGNLDPDGLAAALKPWLDALTAVGIWRDDELAAADFRVKQERASDGKGHTTIKIQPLEIELVELASRRRKLAV